MKQREILGDIAPDFRRDNQTPEEYIRSKKDAIIAYIRRYVWESGMDGVVLGVSGGVDSFLVGALLACALRETPKKLRLVILPNGEQPDYRDAVDSVAAIRAICPQAEWDSISIAGGYGAALLDLRGKAGFAENAYTLGNLQPRLRMTYQYALADGMLVAGTDHAAESVTGFFTKYGDGGTDFNPIQELVKDDIYRMSALLGAPEEVMEKSPAAGLGITADDETEMGMKYGDICAYLKGRRIAPDAARRLEAAYDRSRHKRAMPASPKDDYNIGEPFAFLAMGFDHAHTGGARDALERSVELFNSYPRGNALYVRDGEDAGGCPFPEPLYAGIRKTVNTPVGRYNVFIGKSGAEAGRDSAMGAENEWFGTLADNLPRKVVMVGAADGRCALAAVTGLLAAGKDVTIPGDCLACTGGVERGAILRQLADAGARVF